MLTRSEVTVIAAGNLDVPHLSTSDRRAILESLWDDGYAAAAQAERDKWRAVLALGPEDLRAILGILLSSPFSEKTGEAPDAAC